MKNAILILGMHRSGTSALARVVNLLGVDLSSDLMGPREADNERGFWESTEIARLHDELLVALGTTWDDTSPLPPDWWRRHEAACVRDALLEVLSRDFCQSQWWAVKDPRLCRLLPLWLDILNELRCRPMCITITRSPAEVVDSLRERSGLSPGFGYPLWLDHVLAAEGQSREIPRFFVAYGRFLEDWRATVIRMADHFGVEWPRSPDDAAAEIDAFLSDDLRHQRVPDEFIFANPELSPWIGRCYAALRRAGEAGESSDLRRSFDSIRDEVAAAQQLYGRSLASHRSERGELREAVSRLEDRECELTRALEEEKSNLKLARRKQIVELERRDDEVLRARESLESALELKNHELSQANDAFSAALQRKDGELAGVREYFETRSQELFRLQHEFEVQHTALHELRDQLQDRGRERDEARAELGELRAKLVETEVQLWRLEAQSQAGRREIEHEREQVAAHLRRVEELELKLRQAQRDRTDIADRLARIESSTTWRLASPLRRLARWARRSAQIEDTAAAKGDEFPAPDPQSNASSREPLVFRPSDSPRVSVIIPVFNQFDYTYACLDSLCSSIRGTEYEVIVVDDASTDETTTLAALAPNIRVLRRDVNAGFVESCNWGARESRGQYLVFLNNDTLLEEGWLAALSATFRDHPQVGAVGPKLVYPDGTLQEVGGVVFSDGSAWNYGRGEDRRAPEYNYVREVDYCSGACLMISRELFFECGMFDARFGPAYYEDTDLCFSVRRAGKRVLVQPLAEVVHFEGQSCGSDLDEGIKRYQQLHQQHLVDKWADELAAQTQRPDTEPAQRAIVRQVCDRRVGPRVLVLDVRTPMPDNDSGSVRMFRLLQILSGLCSHVTFAAETFEYLGHYTAALQHLGVEVLYRPYVDSLETHLKGLAQPYDVVITSRFYVAERCLDTIRRCAPDAKLIFDTVDLHFLRDDREIAVTGRSSVDDSFENMRESELAIARRCDLTLVVSQAEKVLLEREYPDLAVDLLSNVHVPQPTGRSFAERSGIIFVGGFEHTPNRDAIHYYAREIHPLIQRRLPGLVLTVIGRSVPSDILRLECETMRLIGQVPELLPYFDAARLSIAPLRFGAGVKGKINSSMCYGVPVVTTSIGAEGIEASDRENLVIADDAEGFARAIEELYTDEELWARVASGGFENIRKQFSFEVAERKLRKILEIRDDQPRRSSVDGELAVRALSLRPTMVDFETP